MSKLILRPVVLILCSSMVPFHVDAIVHRSSPNTAVVRQILNSRLVVIGRLSEKRKNAVRVEDGPFRARGTITTHYEAGVILIEKKLHEAQPYTHDDVWVYWNEPDGRETSSSLQPRTHQNGERGVWFIQHKSPFGYSFEFLPIRWESHVEHVITRMHALRLLTDDEDRRQVYELVKELLADKIEAETGKRPDLD